jgi:putative transposase
VVVHNTRKKHNKYWVSFCYEDHAISQENLSEKAHLKALKNKGRHYLEAHTIGIDRGVARPVQCSDSDTFFDLTEGEKRNKTREEKQVRRFQKKLSRQKKGSNRRHKTKIRLSDRHSRIANIRENFCHQTSRKIVDQEKTKVIIFENLGIKRMTRKPKAKQDENGKWLRNNARAKAGLNKSILDKNWHLLEAFTKYKAKNEGKVVFKVAPNHTSQECAHCHHIHPKNRKSQNMFLCLSCGHTDNADVNAAKVVKHRAIQFILNSGTELSKSGVLSLGDSGRGDKVRRKKLSGNLCGVDEASKKKVASATGSSMAVA